MTNKRLQALPELLRAAERRVNKHLFGRDCGDSATLASIPANPDHDVDLLLIEAAQALEGMRVESEPQTATEHEQLYRLRPLCICKPVETGDANA